VLCARPLQPQQLSVVVAFAQSSQQSHESQPQPGQQQQPQSLAFTTLSSVAELSIDAISLSSIDGRRSVV
jgi:hypothetical protein